ncbi:hypothetical protein RHODOSMS8_01806 [Rhodobiaceae bacterium]|nr:hypothetical protein RHODOSMS8_01806 [Rhodobiaceae bacterium]
MAAPGAPLFGLYVSWFAAILDVIAAFAGDRVFATATPIIAVISTLFFSPLALAAFAVEKVGGSNAFLYITIIVFAAPFVAMIFEPMGKSVSERASG